MDKSEKLKALKKELEKMKSFHESIWIDYGSELCAGDMRQKENNLQDQIDELKKEIND